MEHKGNKAIYMSVTELASMLGISRTAVIKRITKGQIKARKIGNNYAIPMEAAHEIIGEADDEILTEERKKEIKLAIEKVVEEYGETLKLLGKE